MPDQREMAIFSISQTACKKAVPIHFQGCADKYLINREIFTMVFMNLVFSPLWQKEKFESHLEAEGETSTHILPLRLGRSFLSPSKNS